MRIRKLDKVVGCFSKALYEALQKRQWGIIDVQDLKAIARDEETANDLRDCICKALAAVGVDRK